MSVFPLDRMHHMQYVHVAVLGEKDCPNALLKTLESKWNKCWSHGIDNGTLKPILNWLVVNCPGQVRIYLNSARISCCSFERGFFAIKN